jgi:predicted nucleic acid-binding protein
MPHSIIIADTSCLIGLNNIGRFDLLRDTYTSISITPEVKLEFGEPLPDWIEITPVPDRQKQLLLELEVDKGEASAIALALEKKDSLLIIDEKKGRKIAKSLGINILGTLGVLIQAKKAGFLSALKPEIEKLEQTGFRISEVLKVNILASVGEHLKSRH